MGRLQGCCLLLLPLPTQLICKEAETDELHLQAGQGRPGNSSHWREGAGCGEKLQCSEMTVLNGHGDGIELILPITSSNCSLQLIWPIASKCTRSTQVGMQSSLFYWQLTSSCTSNEILSKLIMRIILSILVNMEMHLAEVSLLWGNRSHFK